MNMKEMLVSPTGVIGDAINFGLEEITKVGSPLG